VILALLFLLAQAEAAPEAGAALAAALRAIRQDGPFALSEAAQKDAVAMLPPARKGEDLALELFTAAASTELRLFTRRDTGFAFGEVGALREFASSRECAAGSEEGSGHASTVKTEKGGLEVLRIDARCGGAPWQASCSFWRLERDSLAHSGVCSLPQRLDAKALRAAGWR
jgi:hypothetical protein